MIQKICFYGLVLAFASVVSAKTSFYTERLKTIASIAGIHVPDSLGYNLTIDSLCVYKGRAVKLKTNGLGDVSHIGYRLFGKGIIDKNDPMMPFYNFIERYFLELDMELDKRKPGERLFLDKVECPSGNIALRHQVTEQTGFSIRHVGRREYTIRWILDKDTLELVVPADCQLILGADAIELEKIFERDLKRIVPTAFVCDWSDEEVAVSEGGYGIVHAGSYLSDEIRSDLYCREQGDSLVLVTDVEKPVESIRNVLLTGCFMRDISMALTINRYGYQKSRIGITLQQFVEYCRMEGCVSYVGIKTHTENKVIATVFALNNELGYNHVLSVEFPIGILEGRPISLTGTTYVYIPLQNVTEKFFMHKTKGEQL